MRLSYLLVAAATLVLAAPAAAQNEAAPAVNTGETNTAAPASPTMSGTAPGTQSATVPANAAAPAPTEPAPSDNTGNTAPPIKSSFPWGVLGVIGLVGLFGRRRST